MSSKKTILYITSRYPYPLEKGDKLRAYHQIKALSLNHDIILCSITDKKINENWKRELDQYCKKQYIYELNPFLIYFNTIKMLFFKMPFQVGYFFQKKIKKNISNIIKNDNPNVIFCQLIRVSEYIKDIHHIPKTIDYMDTLSEGMFKRAKIAVGLKRFLLKAEGTRLKKYENKIFDYFNNHIIISEQDRELIQHPKNKTIKVVPNGIDNSFLTFESHSIKKEYDIVFVGNLSYAPNIEACQYIVNKIAPLFNKKGIKILLSGANPSTKILKLKSNNVTVSGWIDDIRQSYCSGKVFVAPLFIGTGLQNKILESMALGIPCVTTSLVNNAINCTHHKNILIANSETEFFIEINRLLSEPKMASKVSKSAKLFVTNKYNWQNASSKIILD